MRITTLCGMGFGTSMMLKLFIEDILKENKMKNVEVVPTDLGSFKGQEASTDIVVAPFDMEQHLKSSTCVVVLIRNLVDKQEIREKVLDAIEKAEQRKGGDEIGEEKS